MSDWIAHLGGVDWHEAPIPPKRHECWAQSWGFHGLDLIERCACGGINIKRHHMEEDVWLERNTRRREA